MDWEALARKAGWEVQGRVFVQEGKQAWADPAQPDAWENLCEEMGIVDASDRWKPPVFIGHGADDGDT